MRGVGCDRSRASRAGIWVAALGALLAGCSSLSTPAANFSTLFEQVKPQGDANAAATPDFECPSIVIRQGAATYSISADPKDTTALNLKYQVGIGETARECKLVAGTVTMRIGIQGRVVLGPSGGPGTIEVPLRFAVVQENVEPKTIVTKLERVAVVIPQSDPHVLFSHIEEGISFPMPRGGLIDTYVLYVGFDPLGARPIDKRRAPPAKKRAAPAKLSRQ